MLRHIIVGFLMFCAWPVLGQPRVLLVGNEGSDSPSCGELDQKCRSISQAIRNSADGDTVFVQAGVYGDLNRNGVFGEPGEETPGSDMDRACECLILINKRISILSERGAAATIIDASSLAGTTTLAVVRVDGSAEGAAVGYTGMGFTVVAPENQARPWIRPIGIWASVPATIAGNRVVGSVRDLNFGDSSGIVVNTVPGGEIYDNEVSGFEVGIAAEASRVFGNVVTRNRYGLAVANGFNPDFSPVDAPSVVEDNFIADNEIGVSVGLGVGVLAITGNDIVHNKVTGIHYIVHVATRFRGANLVIQDNNIIDNGYGTPQKCALINEGVFPVWATHNYWGVPGTSNGVCEVSVSRTQVDPIRLQPDGPRPARRAPGG